jgi:hypothetical protein
MSFKRLEGLTAKGTPITLFRAIVVNAEQFKLAQDMIAANNGEPLMTRKVILSMNEALRPGKAYMPYFISKNVACKTKTFGVYDLSKLKLSAAAKAAAVETPAPESTPISAPKTKRVRAKRESKPKLGQPETPVAESVEHPPLGIEAPAVTE